MKILRCCLGLFFWLLTVGETTAAEPVAVKREAQFTGAYARAAKGMQLPKLIKSAPPKYPVRFRDAGLAGTATVEFIISEKGVPEEVQCSSATDQAFADAACAAVRKWRYEPGRDQGKPVRIRTRQRVDFKSEPARNRVR
jgi:TonB family protein